MWFDDVLGLVGALSPVFVFFAYQFGVLNGRSAQLDDDCRTVKRVLESRVDELKGGE